MNNNSIKALLQRIALGGMCSDKEFDAIYPAAIRHLSYSFWSTFELSVKAAIIACHTSGAKVLDIGSGSGKFCLIGSLVTDGQFYGVENRKYLVEAARKIAKLSPARPAHYILGDLADVDWSNYDSVFMFNPLNEYQNTKRKMDKYARYDMALYQQYRDVITRKLSAMRKGSRLISVCQLDYVPPSSFKKIHYSMVDGLPFDAWQKV